MTTIHTLLELSDRHLPPHLADDLPDSAYLTAVRTAFGMIVHVPADLPTWTATSVGVPVDVVRVLRYAQALDCDTILFAHDIDEDDALPTWLR